MAAAPRPTTPPATAAVAQSRSRKTARGPAFLPRGAAKPGRDFTVGSRVARSVTGHAYERRPDEPVYRPLRIYALDPSAATSEGALATVNVPYEPVLRTPDGIQGATLAIVDAFGGDPAVPGTLDLDHPFVLMRQGHAPSPEDPLFRQQMAYAVCSTTYAAFRHALGREIAWGYRRHGDEDSRLRIRPCVHELQNAYYDPATGEIRFGTFTAGAVVRGRNVPGGMVSLALSHDIVVHEMSHALLDGLRSHFLFPSNADVLAFHEGFADLVAIFQRFTYRDVVGAAIRASRGVVSSAALLTDIARQFAQATNTGGALRSATSGSERRYEDATEPHQRGEILVAAVFEAYVRVYERKTVPLLRLATGGTGVLPPGDIPDGLARQLAERASSLAAQFLAICIRAIDYCPPVDITFGEFLRAVITADSDLVPQDEWGYREAWVDAFAARRLYPAGVPSLSESALRWRAPEQQVPPEPELGFANLRFDGDPGRVADIDELMRQADAFGQLAADPRYCAEFGLARAGDVQLAGDTVSLPVVESVRPSRRVGPDGQVVFDLIAEVTQQRSVRPRDGRSGFDFYGGATVILDPRGNVRYVIRKSVLDDARLERQRAFVQGDGGAFFGPIPGGMHGAEPRLLLGLHAITRPQLRASAGTRALLRGEAQGVEVAAARRFLLRRDEQAPWVPLLKTCLASCLDPAPPLEPTTTYDAATEAAVSRLQRERGASVDGIIGPATWTLIGRILRGKKQVPPGDAPAWIRNLLAHDPASSRLISLDVNGALEMVEFSYGALSASQRIGLSGLLGAVCADTAVTDLRWAAYMLATVKHECADTWQPMDETGKGAGREYGKPVTVIDSAGQPHENAYYGRGYVQLTWRENYRAAGRAIGRGDELEIHPELALDPAVAYAVMSHGMREGLFTGRGLARYIGGDRADYANARRIINGTDRAELIAQYAARFETILLAYAG
jgi:peptidoglycan hydrolase-like protein with peptidoglycan-binding domain